MLMLWHDFYYISGAPGLFAEDILIWRMKVNM